MLSLALLSAGCSEKWDMTKQPVRDEELDTAFFSGLDSKEVADVPEPASLRPCCIFGTEVGAQVRSVPVPFYEISNIVDLDSLGTHQYNKGAVALVPRGGQRVVSDEESGILYTCRGGFIDISHVRDNADRTLYLASQIARHSATGGVIPIAGEGATRRIVLKPLDARLVHEYGLREVVTSLAEWLDFQASIWHEIATWYGWASTRFSERPSAFSPEDMYSNVVGLKIAGVILRRHQATSELEYNQAVTALLRDALKKLGPLPRAATRRAFEYTDGIWWDSTKRVPDNQLVRHRNFDVGPKIYPWKLSDAKSFSDLHAAQQEFDRYCQGDWKPLGLTVRDRLGKVPFQKMATLEVVPEEVLVRNGFPFPKPGLTMVTPADFPGIIAAIQRAAEIELGSGVGSPVARATETSRYHQ
jgi:hypothetical protein